MCIFAVFTKFQIVYQSCVIFDNWHNFNISLFAQIHVYFRKIVVIAFSVCVQNKLLMWSSNVYFVLRVFFLLTFVFYFVVFCLFLSLSHSLFAFFFCRIYFQQIARTFITFVINFCFCLYSTVDPIIFTYCLHTTQTNTFLFHFKLSWYFTYTMQPIQCDEQIERDEKNRLFFFKATDRSKLNEITKFTTFS